MVLLVAMLTMVLLMAMLAMVFSLACEETETGPFARLVPHGFIGVICFIPLIPVKLGFIAARCVFAFR